MGGIWRKVSKENVACAIFLICLFLRGGYFYYESFAILAIASFLTAIGGCTDSEGKGQQHRRDLLLPFLYFLFFLICPLFYSGSMHCYGLLKIFAPFWLIRGMLYFWKPSELLRQILKAYIMMLACAIAFCMVQILLQSTEIWQQVWQDFPFPVVIKGRFTGFLQYANVNAILSLMAGIYAIYHWKNRAAIWICGLSLGLSGSRTGWILAICLVAGAFLCFLVATPKKQIRFFPDVIGGNFWFLCGLMIGGMILFYTLGENRLEAGLGASELHTRLLYYKDGLKMIWQRPWGYGHYGYYLSQRQFQTGSTYFVKYIHNFLLQSMLDGGVFSSLVWLWILGASGYRLFCMRRLETNLIGVSFLALVAHAFWDFDFQFNYVLILIWIVYFYCRGDKNEILDSKNGYVIWKSSQKLGRKALYIALALFSLVMSFLSWQNYQGDYRLFADLGFTDARISLVQDISEKEEQRVKTAHSMENNLIKNVETFAFLRNYYYNKGKLKEAIVYGKEAVALAPLWIEHRQELMRVQYAFALTNVDEIEEVAEDILSVPEVLKELERTRTTKLNVRHRPQWKMTTEMEQWHRHFKILYERVQRTKSPKQQTMSKVTGKKR